MNRIMLLSLSLVASLIAGCMAAPVYQGEASARFDGKRFRNSVPMTKSFGDLLRLRWGTFTQAEEWPQWIDIPQKEVPQERVWSGLSITYVNHSTFLIQVDGLNILTDPIYSQRASPVQWAGPKRVHAPGIALEALPPIDVILISHNHYDHLDEATLRALLGRSAITEPTLLPIGAYAPRWFMNDVHLNPEEAVKAHRALESELSIGIHFGTFQLTYEAIDQPLIDLSLAMGAYELAPKEFVVMKPGETLGVAPDPEAM